MRYKQLPRMVAALALACAGIAACRFPNQSAGSHYARLFAAPSGRNGYEEFAMATDLANASAAWQEAEHTGSGSLDLKRRVLADPLIRRSLEAVRAGLKKPVAWPYPSGDMTTPLPELGDFRSVGRLIALEMEARFGDGQPNEALDDLEVGLSYGRHVQVGGLASGVVGLYVENTILEAFARHLAELRPQDCDRLMRITSTHLRLPDVELSLVAQERDICLRTYTGHRSDALALLNVLDPGPNASRADHTDFMDVRDLVRARPERGPGLMDEAARLVRQHYDGTLAELRRPVWERSYPSEQERDSPAARLVFSLCPRSYSRLGDRFARERALVRILAAHAAALRYRYRHNRLPDNLDTLSLGANAIDPFTGSALGYTQLGDGAFTIASAGPRDPRDATGARRVPLVVRYPGPG